MSAFGPIRRKLFRTPIDVDWAYNRFQKKLGEIAIVGVIMVTVTALVTFDWHRAWYGSLPVCAEAGPGALLDSDGRRICS